MTEQGLPAQVRIRGLRGSAVYHRTMGLFRRRGKKNREKAAFLAAQTKAAEEHAEVARREVTAEEQAEVAHREVTAEERPNPDHPGWGQTIGQEIGRARANRISQE